MRARWLKPEFFRDKKIATLSPLAALVYQGLWLIADDSGMAPCDPELLKGELFTYWSAAPVPEITGALQELFALGRITFFQGSDELFCQVLNFERHQNVHKPSKFRNALQYKDFRATVPEWCGTSSGKSGTPHHLDTYTPRHLDTKITTPAPAAPKSKVSPVLSHDEQRVFDHYAATHPRRKTDPIAAKKLLAKALTVFTVDELILAIDGNARDEWHRQKHKHELSYVLRDAEKISSFIDRATPTSSLVLNPDGDPTLDSLLRILNS